MSFCPPSADGSYTKCESSLSEALMSAVALALADAEGMDGMDDLEDSLSLESNDTLSEEAFKTPSAPRSPFRMSQHADVAWTVVFSLMIVSAIVGNLIVFWIVLGHRRMQNVTNYFLVNLSLADLVMSCLNTIFNFNFMKNRTWVFGSAYCTMNNFIAYLSVAVSVLTLMAISIDRYIAIVRPLRPRMSKTSARVVLVVVWTFSAVLSMPAILYSKTVTITYDNGENMTVCFMLWPDGPPAVSQLDYIYNIVYFLLTYIVPIVSMGVCYSRIGCVLWGKGPEAEAACDDLAQERKLASKRKVVKMFIVVVIIFAVCWLPYHAYFIYTYHHPDILAKPFIQHVYLGFYWLAMANSMFNPFVYYWMNARFRGYFLSLLTSVRILLCKPARLFRSDSKSSLNIGVVPANNHHHAASNREMAHFMAVPRKRDFLRVRDHSDRTSTPLLQPPPPPPSPDPNHNSSGGCASAAANAATAPNAAHRPCASPSRSSALHHINCCRSRSAGADASSASAPEAFTQTKSSKSQRRHQKYLTAVHRSCSSNSSQYEDAVSGSVSSQPSLYHAHMATARSDDALIRITVPFRNNPVLRDMERK